MERVLDIYKRPYSKNNPVVCMDESPKQLIGETRTPIEMKTGVWKSMITSISVMVCAIYLWLQNL